MRNADPDRYELYALIFPNGKQYAGISYNTDRRFEGHAYCAARGVKLPVYDAMRKYDVTNTRAILLVVGSESYIKTLEIAYINKFQLRDRRYGYNLAMGGDVSPMRVPEIAAKVSATKRRQFVKDPTMYEAFWAGRDRPEVVRRRLATIRTPEVCAKKSVKLRGRKHTDKARANMKMAQNRPEVKAALSNAQATIWTFEKRATHNQHLHDRIVPQDQRDKISATLTGHPGYGKGQKFPERAERISSLRWITNGTDSSRIPIGDAPPNGWRFGRRKNV